jgi:hypothetical protein
MREGMNKGEQQIPTKRDRERIVLPMKNPFLLLLSISSMMKQRMREREMR